MGAVNQSEILVLRARVLDPGADGSFTPSPPDGYVFYPDGRRSSPNTNITFSRTSAGIYVLSLPRNFSQQEEQVFVQIQDTAGVVQLTYSGATAPLYNTITVTTIDAITNTATASNWTIRITRCRFTTAGG